MSVLTSVAEDEEKQVWRLRTTLRCMRDSKDKKCLMERELQDVYHETKFL